MMMMIHLKISTSDDRKQQLKLIKSIKKKKIFVCYQIFMFNAPQIAL